MTNCSKVNRVSVADSVLESVASELAAGSVVTSTVEVRRSPLSVQSGSISMRTVMSGSVSSMASVSKPKYRRSMRAFCRLVGTTRVNDCCSKAVARAPLKVVLQTASLT